MTICMTVGTVAMHGNQVIPAEAAVSFGVMFHTGFSLLILFLLLLLLLLLGDIFQESLRLCRFISDRDEIWQDQHWSSSIYASIDGQTESNFCYDARPVLAAAASVGCPLARRVRVYSSWSTVHSYLGLFLVVFWLTIYLSVCIYIYAAFIRSFSARQTRQIFKRCSLFFSPMWYDHGNFWKFLATVQKWDQGGCPKTSTCTFRRCKNKI